MIMTSEERPAKDCPRIVIAMRVREYGSPNAITAEKMPLPTQVKTGSRSRFMRWGLARGMPGSAPVAACCGSRCR